jgi:hypothetical protein
MANERLLPSLPPELDNATIPSEDAVCRAHLSWLLGYLEGKGEEQRVLDKLTEAIKANDQMILRLWRYRQRELG